MANGDEEMCGDGYRDQEMGSDGDPEAMQIDEAHGGSHEERMMTDAEELMGSDGNHDDEDSY